MPKPAPGQPPKYSGTFDCFKKIVAQEGFLGLYKGMSAPLASVAPACGLSFFSFGVGKRLQQKHPSDELLLHQSFLAGAFSGLCCTVVMAPVERIKCLLQTQSQTNGKPKYNGVLDTGYKLYKDGGLRSLFKGTTATILRDIPASGMYFLTYDYFQKLLTPKDPVTGKAGQTGFFNTVFAGGMAGIGCWSVGMPADVLKSRLQSAPEGTYPHGLKSVFAELMQKEGPMALYKGIVPVMLRAFPANAACFIGFEACMKFLNWVAPMVH